MALLVFFLALDLEKSKIKPLEILEQGCVRNRNWPHGNPSRAGVLTNIVARQANLLILHPKVTPVFYGERNFSHLLLSICVIEAIA